MADTQVKRGRAPLWGTRRGTWGNAAVLAWLVAAAAAAVVRTALPVPLWLVVHLFVLGAASTAIVLWSEHFTVTWCGTPPSRSRSLPARVSVLTLAVLAVLIGITAGVTELALSGAAAVIAVGIWHAMVLVRLTRYATVHRFRHAGPFYVAAAVSLLVAVLLAGALISLPISDSGWLALAHVHIALLGWLGLSVLGTLVTLWPVVLRTRVVPGAERIGRISWWPLVLGLATLTGGLLTEQRAVAVAGLAGYAVGAATMLVPFVRTACRKPPHDAASWSLAAGTAWLPVTLACDAALLASGSEPAVLTYSGPLLSMLLAGFAAQVLVGALTYLLVPVLARRPRARDRVTEDLQFGWRSRLIAGNLAVPMVALPVPSELHTAAWATLAACYGGFALLALRAVRRSRIVSDSPQS